MQIIFINGFSTKKIGFEYTFYYYRKITAYSND